MNKLVAVSGGVDSVVLLDILSRGSDRLVVAHVDHGIRPESGGDARFVEALASRYRLPYVSTELNLGASASEEEAREGRYDFLFSKAKELKAVIVTAHHQDDVIGSAAINLTRGTGWRGLAVMNRSGIERPLLGWSKQRIYSYALDHRLEWVEDVTNQSPVYMRNRLRPKIVSLGETEREMIMKRRASQLQLARDIDREASRVLQRFGDRRYPYAMIPSETAIELLRRRTGLPRPAAERLLISIKTAKPNTTLQLTGELEVKFDKKSFQLTSPDR